MHILAMILQGVFALAFTLTALRKLVGTSSSVKLYAHFGLSPWFRVVTGLVELLIAGGMVLGDCFPVFLFLALVQIYPYIGKQEPTYASKWKRHNLLHGGL
jgi:hypothetical protein